MSDQITISVDPEVADAYRSASAEDRRKLDILVNLRLKDATRGEQPLSLIMAEISQNAQQRGMTPDILRDILAE